VRVLMSFGPSAVHADGNPYTSSLLKALSGRVDCELFNWRFALSGQYDVFHIHWPEHLVAGRNGDSILRAALVNLLVLRLRAKRVKVVRTIHNEFPHQEMRSRYCRRAMQHLDGITTSWIAMNRGTRSGSADRQTTFIPHGHYRDAYPSESRGPWKRAERETPQFLYFGPIHEYKGVSRLLHAISGSANGVSLRVLGQNTPHGLSKEEVAAARKDPRVTLELRHAEERELIGEIRNCDCVVLPYTRMHNSGAVLLALSLNRPVIVPATPSTKELEDEFGREWVITYDGDLDAQTFDLAVTRLRESIRSVAPDMSRREWPAIADATIEVYQASSYTQHMQGA
jgi:beta-1,4-mannosyltransferase